MQNLHVKGFLFVCNKNQVIVSGSEPITNEVNLVHVLFPLCIQIPPS